MKKSTFALALILSAVTGGFLSAPLRAQTAPAFPLTYPDGQLDGANHPPTVNGVVGPAFTYTINVAAASDSATASGLFSDGRSTDYGTSIIKTGAGTLILSHSNTYTGDTTISGGTLTIQNVAALGSGSGSVTITGGSIWKLDVGNKVVAVAGVSLQSGSITTASVANPGILTSASGFDLRSGSVGVILSGSGALTKSTAGTVTLTNLNNYTGGTFISGGTLALTGNAFLLPTSGAITINGTGILDLGAYNRIVGALSMSESAQITGTGTLITSSLDLQAGSIYTAVSSASTLTKSGSGTVTLYNAVNVTGGTTITGGILQMNNGGSLGAVGILGGTLALAAGNLTAGAVTLDGGSITGPGPGTLTASSFDFRSGLVTASLAGSGGLSKSTAGTLTLANVNSYTGSTTISGGTLTMGNVLALGTSAVSIGAGATLNAAGFTFDLERLSGSGTLTGSGFFIHNGSGSVATKLAGTANFTKSGTGALTLTGANSYTGGTFINGGTLTMGNALALGTNAVSIGIGATVNAAGFGFDLERLSGPGTLTGTGFYSHSGSGSLATKLAGTASFAKYGSGTLTLTGANSYTGGTTISGGTLNAGSAGALGSSGKISFGGSGTLQFSAANTTDYSSRFDTAAQYFRFDTNGQNVTFATGLASSGGTLTKIGSGTLTLSGANTYTGGTTISAGILQIGSGGTSGSVTGNITNNAALVFNRSDALAYTSAISGSGSLTKQGTGTLTLSGQNTYAGLTALSAGTLLINGSLANTAVSVANGATLGGSGSIGGLTTFTSGAHLAPGNSPGTLTFNAGLVLQSGSILDFQLGTSSDQIVLAGGSLTGPGTVGGVTLNLSNSGGFTAGTYTLINYTSAVASSGYAANSFTLGTTIPGYTYNLSLSGNSLQLTAASAIPEPSTYAASAAFVALAFAVWRRSRQHCAARFQS